MAGHGYVGVERLPVFTGQAIQFGSGGFVKVSASEIQDSRSKHLELLMLGGRPIREPVAWHGPFVMNSRQELMEAFQDYKQGKLGVIPAK